MEELRVGDHWTYDVKDELTGEVKSTSTNLVTDITGSEVNIRVTALGTPNSGYYTFDKSWNLKSDGLWRFTPNDGSGLRQPLEVGKSWSFTGTEVNSHSGFSNRRSGKSKIVGQESVTTPAGTFQTFKIETTASLTNANDPTRKYQFVMTTWYAPLINHWVKRTAISRADGHVRNDTSFELVEYGRK